MKLNKLMIALVAVLTGFASSATAQVAKIGDTPYATLAEAVAAAENGAVVTMTADVALNNGITIAGKAMTLDLNGKTVSGVCNAGSSSLVAVRNDANLTVKDGATGGKLTYAQGASNVGWTIFLEGALTLESGTIELTGSWSIGYAVDARPNAWGTAYNNPTIFTINGGELISSDAAVRVASTSAPGYKNVSTSFVMNGGRIDAAWDGVFVQQSDAVYDALNVTFNGGKVESDLNPVRVYGPLAESYVNEQDCMNITFNGGEMEYTGSEPRTWIIEGVLRAGNEMTFETIQASGDIVATEVFVEANAPADGLVWQANGDGTYSVVDEATVAGTVVAKVNGVTYTTLADAFAAADGKTVTLLEDVELQETLVVTGTTTLDLNGKTISQTKLQTAGYSMIQNDGNLTIEDNVGGGKISYTDSGNGGEYISNTITNRGTLIVNDGILENLSSETVKINGYPYVIDTSIWGPATEVNTIINGGSLYCAYYSALRLRADSATEPVNITVTGGEISGCIEVQLATQKAAGKGQLTINGGKISNTGTANAIFVFGSEGSAENLALSITDGEVSGNVTVKPSVGANFDSQFISGGTFSTDVTDFCEHWHEVTSVDGKYEVAVQNEIKLKDGEFTQFANDMDIEVASINYTRKFKNAKVWNAVFLPFEVALSEDFLEKYDVAEWTGVQANVSDDVLESWGIELTKIKDPAAVLQANHPYFIYVKDAKDLTFEVSLTNATLFATVADNKEEHTVDGVMTCTMSGNYKKLTGEVLKEPWVVSASGQWIHAGSMNPFRVLMTRKMIGDVEVPTATSSTMRVIIREPNGTTAIEDAVIDAVQDNVVYDLQGRRVMNPTQGGIYIVNGKKVIKK
ncbi:MAG: hypothetical protein J6S02_05885 [Bacteroidaceae bacterium]|nr:hypothetical protein [Bacteroidaceae bacterium]